jgi:glycerol-3-phosphate dehydrogenase
VAFVTDGRGRRITSGLADVPDRVDLVVAGLGVTGAGVALDAVTRGLSVLAVDAHDIAFGTSRWSSKLVHGGLRYLAHGQVGVAHESAVERRILMETTAPHLTHALPMLVPLHDAVGHGQAAVARAGLAAGDLLRVGARTARGTLPPARRVSATEALSLAPGLRVQGLRGGLLGWDGQLEDDARLVVTIARTAAAYGAHVRTRVRVLAADGAGVRLRDEQTGAELDVSARMVVNAAGVWAGELADVGLQPSRGTHVVLRAESLAGTRVCVTAPVPGSSSRFVMALPQPDGTVYVGLTDEPVDGPVPDVPEPSEHEVDFLLDVVSATLAQPLTRDHVVGAFAGLRPLLRNTRPGGYPSPSRRLQPSRRGRNADKDGPVPTADLSRRHAVLTSPDGVVTVVGGKLTTYRRMAQDAVDAALAAAGLDPRPCRTSRLPLLGAADRTTLARLVAEGRDPRLVRRFGTDADLVLADAREVTGLGDDALLAPATPQVRVTLAELVFGVTHEGAADAADLLDRRTRVGLVPADRPLVEPLAHRALSYFSTAAPG